MASMNMKNPKISVVVPIYNGEKYVDAFIENINRLNFLDYEVLLIDDGSTDDTYENCKEYESKNSRIKVYQKENGGPSSARNMGIDNACGEYIVFFDIDDEFDEKIFEDNYILAGNNDADVVMWNFKLVDLKNKKEAIKLLGKSFSGNQYDFFHQCLITVIDNEMFNPPWNKMIKRELLLKTNVRFNEAYSIYEDILFSFELFDKASKIVINDKVYYNYVVKESGSLLKTFHKECFEVILEIYSKALEYGRKFEENEEQIYRFNKQFIYLTKGFIKQICVDEKLSNNEKKYYLSLIRDNSTYDKVCREYDNDFKSSFAKKMMLNRKYDRLISYYIFLDSLKSFLLDKKM